MTPDMTGNPSDGLSLEQLSRWPDVQAENLLAHDATDRLLLDLASEAIVAAGDGGVVTIGDRYGALTLGAARLGARQIRVHQDSFTSRLALDHNSADLDPKPYSQHALGEGLLTGSKVVLIQLPKDLAQLKQWSAMIAAYADSSVQVFAGGRIKHMTRSMNGVLEEFFEDVSASRARQKSRIIFASRPKSVPAGTADPEPGEFYDEDLGMWVAVYPGVFSPGKVDLGTRFLIPFVEQEAAAMRESHAKALPDAADPEAGPDAADPDGLPVAVAPDASRVAAKQDLSPVAVDLGSGTGILAATLRRELPGWRVIATDRSEVAMRSTKATLERNFGTGTSMPTPSSSHLPPSLSSPDVLPTSPASTAVLPTSSESELDRRVEVRHDHILSAQPDGSVDLIVCNPPFHSEASISTALSDQIFEDAARALRPGGVMLTVFNSHLRHRGVLSRLVGPTTQVGRNSKFTVTRSVKR